jgi:hypothetical protein
VKASEDLEPDRPEDPHRRVPQAEPEDLVPEKPPVVGEADEPVLLRLDEHVVVQAHLDRLQDGDDHGAAEADGDRHQVGIAQQDLPGAPRQQRARQGSRDGRFAHGVRP